MKNETRMVVLSPKSSLTPSYVVRFLHLLALPLTIKETCYGALIEGEQKDLLRAIEKLRTLDKRIYTKPRGFPIGDERRCRADHGSRPGFTQLEYEFGVLPFVDEGVCDLRKGKIEEKKKKYLSADELKRIMESEV